MRRLLAWIGGAVGGLAAYRLLRRRSQLAPEPQSAAPEPDARAEELRTKLAESRTVDPVERPPAAAEEPAEPEESESPEEAESPEERRRRVHEEGRAALDEMKPE